MSSAKESAIFAVRNKKLLQARSKERGKPENYETLNRKRGSAVDSLPFGSPRAQSPGGRSGKG
jgi:hypothetical protein